MFVNEFFFSFFLLSFAALLCLFGLGMLIDGIIRLFAEFYRISRPALVSREQEEEKASPAKRAA